MRCGRGWGWGTAWLNLAGLVTVLAAINVGTYYFFMGAFGAGWGFEDTLTNRVLFMALISINLGLLNLLPIPVLDGGHLMFFTIEGVIRRPLPLRVREIARRLRSIRGRRQSADT